MAGNRLYAVVDIETTGGAAQAAGITEIAVVRTDGQRELGRWSRLIRPDHPVPAYITALTGISDAMLVDAPTFAEVAPELEELLRDAVFVAHNVGFDYGFIQAAFAEAGVAFARPRLCTVRLARQVYRGLGGYGLSALCQHFAIGNEARHRAMGDCAATVELFHRMLQEPGTEEVLERMLARGSREAWLPTHVPVSDFEALPPGPGVYRFLDKKGAPLYIGMSHEVQVRVRSHFQGNARTSKHQTLLREVHRITAEATGSVLYARLWEDVLIRQFWPPLNRAQKVAPTFYRVECYRNRQGFDTLAIRRARTPRGGLRAFPSETEARNWLFQLADATGIAPPYLGLGGTLAAHPEAALSPDVQNARLAVALAEALPQEASQVCVVMPGPSPDRYGVALAADGTLQALGFWPHPAPPPGATWSQLLELVPALAPSWTADAILAQALDPRPGASPLPGSENLQIYRSFPLP